MLRREKKRDDRDYDTTQLHAASHGKTLGRDYSAHFWRWSFARRFITLQDNVLEIGCGEDRPLSKILTGGASPHVNKYVGVDLNKLKSSESQRLAFHGEFNFVQRYKELLKGDFKKGFDVLVHLEVIEHMRVELGAKFLKAAFEALKPGGVMLMSTPCYDGVRHAANHIHEYTVPELQKAVEKAGFKVERRFGCFMDLKHIGKMLPTASPQDLNPQSLRDAVGAVKTALSAYYDNDALSCLFAPLHPDHARNNLWLCRKPGAKGRPIEKALVPTQEAVAPRKAVGTPRVSAAARFKELIMAGKLSDDALFKVVQKEFGLPDKRRGYVGFYRNELQKSGQRPPTPKQAKM